MNSHRFRTNNNTNEQQNEQQNQASKNVYCGITTRKRAALLNINVVDNKLNKILDLKPNSRGKIIDKENIEEIEVDKDGSQPLEYLIKNPIPWPSCNEFNNKDNLRNHFKTILERKEIIRIYYSNHIISEIPIWFPKVNNDEFMHIDYLPTIIDHLIEKEEFYEPLGRNFLDGSIDINYRHRYTLVDWMVQVHEQLALSNECLQLSIAIMDRFIKSMKAIIKRDDVLIIGVMCLYIAGKVEEVYIHSLSEFLDEVKVNYDLEKCRLLETKILSVLDFKLSVPLPLSFIRHYNLMFKAEPISHFYSRYFCELSLHDYHASGYGNNFIGASCVFLSQVICQKKVSDFSSVWTPALQCCSGLLYNDFRDLVQNLCIIISKQQTPSKYRAIAVKYSADIYKQVAKTVTQTLGFKHILQHFKATIPPL